MKKYIITLTILLAGCSTTDQREEYDLLYTDELKKMAYKSITIKDIIGEKDFN